MALFSLIIKQPFTFQVSKRDYPEIYWKEKTFLAINNIITGVWAAIFIVNATIFLLLNATSRVILSNTLIALGIIFSIVFPLKAPAYFATKEFRKYDWSVNVAQKSEGENEYDVIIVGSGIGGLTCGALLSKRGYRVLVLEQHHQVGGYCSSFMFIYFSKTIFLIPLLLSTKPLLSSKSKALLTLALEIPVFFWKFALFYNAISLNYRLVYLLLILLQSFCYFFPSLFSFLKHQFTGRFLN